MVLNDRLPCELPMMMGCILLNDGLMTRLLRAPGAGSHIWLHCRWNRTPEGPPQRGPGRTYPRILLESYPRRLPV